MTTVTKKLNPKYFNKDGTLKHPPRPKKVYLPSLKTRMQAVNNADDLVQLAEIVNQIKTGLSGSILTRLRKIWSQKAAELGIEPSVGGVLYINPDLVALCAPKDTPAEPAASGKPEADAAVVEVINNLELVGPAADVVVPTV